jgi:hypothetical protein
MLLLNSNLEGNLNLDRQLRVLDPRVLMTLEEQWQQEQRTFNLILKLSRRCCTRWRLESSPKCIRLPSQMATLQKRMAGILEEVPLIVQPQFPVGHVTLVSKVNHNHN